jgi:hypothetical protein
VVSNNRRTAEVDEVLTVPLQHEWVREFVLDVAGIANDWIVVWWLGGYGCGSSPHEE